MVICLKFNKSFFVFSSIKESNVFPEVLACSLKPFINSLSVKFIFLNSFIAALSSRGLNLKSLLLSDANLCLE